MVPIQPGSKKPDSSEWLKKTFTPEDFAEGMNIAVKNGAHSGWKVDVDCDAIEAVRSAGLLLPTTGLVHGRSGKPSSHYWYIAPNTESQQFKDINGDVLIELRSTGGYTVVPPGRHTSGEDITWEVQRGPLALEAAELKSAVINVAIAALFARHWPASGRHHACGHLGGFLSRCGLPAMTVEHIVETVTLAAGEAQNWARENAQFARESAEKNERNEKTTGAPHLKESFPDGEKLIARVYEWLGREGDDKVDELNEIHFVARLGKGMAVGIEEPEGVTFQNYTDFQQLYFNQHVGKKKLGLYWLEHPRRRTHRTVVFYPPGYNATVDPRDYNLWRGFAVEPDPQPNPETRIARYLEHTYEVVCDANQVHYDYVLDLLADVVQRPGRPIGKALALRGRQGVGKSVWVESFGKRLFGRSFVCVSHRDEIVGKFNSHLSGKIVVFADEAVWGGNRQDIGTLKKLVTQDTINIERKGIDKVTEPNCIHLFLATNEDWVWPAGDRERRGVILDLQREIPHADPYWERLWAEVESPAFAPALLAFLQQRQINYMRLRTVLDTQALRDQQDMSADLARQWWKMKLEDGRLSSDTWPEFIDSDWLWEDFRLEMGTQRGAGYSLLGARFIFIKKLKLMLPAATRTTQRVVETNVAKWGQPILKQERKSGFLLPPLEECRMFYDRLTGTRNCWPKIEAQPDPGLMKMLGDDDEPF